MLLGGLLGTVAVPFLLMNISTALGVTTYGDYSEIRSNELASVLAATPDLSEVEIPMGIEYVLLDKNYQIIETTLDEGELEHAMRYATTGVIDQNLKKDTCLSLVKMSMLSCNTILVLIIQMSG